MLAAVLAFFVFFAIIALAIYVWSSLALMAIYKKAEHPHPWAAWVPFYRDYVQLELGGQTGWLIFVGIAASVVSPTFTDGGVLDALFGLLTFVLVAAATVFYIFAALNINRAFGKHPVGFTIFAVFLPVIWLSVLAWGRAQYSPALATGPMVPGKGQTFLEMRQESKAA